MKPDRNEVTIDARSTELLAEYQRRICRATDQLFVWVICLQWAGGILLAYLVTPRTWIGDSSTPHYHFWAAWYLGGIISAFPIFLGLRYPGAKLTRYVIAIAQVVWSSLLIHLTGGRIETHFHIFGSLALLAFYRDYNVIIIATVIVGVDHLIRGTWWPESVFGVFVSSPYRWIEHVAWVLFEDIFLFASLKRVRQEMRELCQRQSDLESTNRTIEKTVKERTVELQQARNFSRAVTDSIHASICILDANGNIIDTNAHWEEFASLHGSNREVIGTGANYLDTCLIAEDAWHSDGLSVAAAISEIADANLDHYTNEYPYRFASELRWFQVRFSSLRENGETLIVVAHLEVTDRVHASELLSAAKLEAEKLAYVAEYTDNAVVITDNHGRIEWVNEGFHRVTGYTLDEVRGEKPGQLLQGPATDPRTVAEMNQALAQESGFDVELINYTKSGEEYWVAVEVRPIHDDDNRVVKYIAVESDITQRKREAAERARLNQELIAASRHAGMADVATGVLHNIGNVLTSVNVSLEFVSDRLGKSTIPNICQAGGLVREHLDDFSDYVQNNERGKHLPDFLALATEKLAGDYDAIKTEIEGLRTNVEHMKEVVAMQQTYAKQRPIRQRIAISKVVHDSVNAVGFATEKQGIKLELELRYSGDLVTDKHTVIQILVNLLMNAKQAVSNVEGQNPCVRIITDVTDDSVVTISVCDNGIGIASDQLPRIFEHGFTTKDNGHGFGLHSSANAAKSLSGKLRASSDGPGQGATFTLELPNRSQEIEQCGIAKPEMVGS